MNASQTLTLLNLLAQYTQVDEANLREVFGKFDEYPLGTSQYNDEHRLSYPCNLSSDVISISLPYRPLHKSSVLRMKAPLDKLPCCSYVWIGLYLNCCAVLAGMSTKRGVKLRLLMADSRHRLSHHEFNFTPALVQPILEAQRLQFETRQKRERRILAGRKSDVVQQSLF